MGWMFSSAVFLFCVRVSDKVCVNVCVCVSVRACFHFSQAKETMCCI